MSNAPGVGTSINVKSPPEVWGRPGVGVEIDRCITGKTDKNREKRLIYLYY